VAWAVESHQAGGWGAVLQVSFNQLQRGGGGGGGGGEGGGGGGAGLERLPFKDELEGVTVCSQAEEVCSRVKESLERRRLMPEEGGHTGWRWEEGADGDCTLHASRIDGVLDFELTLRRPQAGCKAGEPPSCSGGAPGCVGAA
jgi:hypothetical protein